MLAFRSASNITTGINLRSVSNGSLIFGIDGNSKKPITSYETCITITVADIIISEGLSFNISPKTLFNKLMELARNVSENYI